MKTILVVDDLEENRYLLQKLLEANNYRVVLAADGVEALEKAQKEAPDLVISDILMPRLDGFALCREWLQHPQFKGIPFVFYTATYTEPKDEEFALSLGAARFIVKPQENAVFLGMIQEVLNRFAKGEYSGREPASVENAVYLKEYNEILVHKLQELEQAAERAQKQNVRLSQEIAERERIEEIMRKQIKELEAWHQVTLEREERIKELKSEVNALLSELGRPPKYMD